MNDLKGVIKKNYNLSHLTRFKTGGNAEMFFKPSDITDLKIFLKHYNKDEPLTIIGAGSNIIIRDNGIEGAVIKFGQGFCDITYLSDNELYVGAGCLNYNLAKFCRINSIGGFEFLVGIPGTIGGGVSTNAGAYGREFKDIIVSIDVIDRLSNIYTISVDQIDFSYRSSNLPSEIIIIGAKFRYLSGDQLKISQHMSDIISERTKTQPVHSLTSGSTFVNPIGFRAWELIDKVGMRGYKIGGAMMSKLHCNFMINDDNATSNDLETLGEIVRETVSNKTGVILSWEIQRIGKK